MMDNNNKHINLNNLKYYNKELQELYIEPLANKINGLNIENGEGDFSVQTPNAPGYEEPVNGFPEGRLTKVSGGWSAAIGYNHKLYGTGGVGFGAYANIRKTASYGGGFGYGNDISAGRANIAIGNGNAIAAKQGCIALGDNNLVGSLEALSAEEKAEILSYTKIKIDETGEDFNVLSDYETRVVGGVMSLSDWLKTSEVQQILERNNQEGRTLGGYRKDTIYVEAYYLENSNKLLYDKMTEQNLNPSSVYVDPYKFITSDLGAQHASLFKLVQSSANVMGAVAIGSSNRATQVGAIATGTHNLADGGGAFTSGNVSEVHGRNAATFGEYNILYGKNIFGQGKGHYIVGSGNDELAVFGRYSKNKDNLLFAVGNGTSDTGRKNAFEIYNDGSMNIIQYGTDDLDSDADLETGCLYFVYE